MAVAPPVMEVRGAAFRYGERSIFAGVDLDIHAGEVVTVLGPNGCGKSTLLRCLGGALALTHGSVRVEGRDIAGLDLRSRARTVGFLFQDHTPAFPFSVLDVASMGRTPYLEFFEAPAARDLALTEQALAQVGILHLKDRPYTELSGGERRLVLLSRTLVQKPAVILLDEPTSHLDLKNQVVCLTLIGGLAAAGRSLVMTTHDPNHAFLFPGQVVLMKPDGSILAGAASTILTDASLSMIYQTDIEVHSLPRRSGVGERTFCTPR